MYRGQWLIEEYGREVARQFRELGVHVNFAPDADVNTNPLNPVIHVRSLARTAAGGGKGGGIQPWARKRGHTFRLQAFPRAWRHGCGFS